MASAWQTEVGREGRVTQYRRGRQAEYWGIAQLREDGYHTIIRAAGSRGVFDAIAIGEHNIKCVQFKRVKGKRMPSYEKDLAAMREVPAMPPCCHMELWVFSDHRKAWIVVPVNGDGN